MKPEKMLKNELDFQVNEVIPYVKQKVNHTHKALQLMTSLRSWFDVEEYLEFLITDLIHLKSVVTGIEVLENTLNIDSSDEIDENKKMQLESLYLATKNWH